MKYFILLVSFIFVIDCYSQESVIDSLTLVINKIKISSPDYTKDSSYVKPLISLGFEYHSTKPEKTKEIIDEALEISKKINYKWGIERCRNMLGIYYITKGNYKAALENLLESLAIAEKRNAEKTIPSILNNITACYYYQKKYSKALEYSEKLLKYIEKSGKQKNIAHFKNNIGEIYLKLNRYSEALNYFKQSLEISRKIDFKLLIAITTSNIAEIKSINGNLAESDKLYEEAILIFVQLGDKYYLARTFVNAAQVALNRKKIKKAKVNLEKGFTIALNLGATDIKRDYHFVSSKIDSIEGNYLSSLTNYKRYIVLRDSLTNKENTKKITQLEMQYDFDKKQREQELLQAQKEALYHEQHKRNILIRNTLIFGTLLLVLIIILVSRSYYNKKKANVLLCEKNAEIYQQKEEILTQRDEIERNRDALSEKNKHITESITYARRIQRAMLPTCEIFQKHGMDSFVFYKPRDIVSGDFFWFKKIRNYILIAIADCTGHGVPGAFMSMLGITLLNEIVRRSEITQPSHVLDELRQEVKTLLDQTGKKEEQKDGMDLAFVAYDIKKMEVQFSGANNPLYLIKNNTQDDCKDLEPTIDNDKFVQIKADKMPIGIYHKEKDHFTNHIINVTKGDVLYLLSDGYIDQTGGKKGRKFLAKNFKKLICKIYKKPMYEQYEIIDETFSDWQKEQNQVDDVLVFGLKL